MVASKVSSSVARKVSSSVEKMVAKTVWWSAGSWAGLTAVLMADPMVSSMADERAD